ncbi:AMP-binding protein [Lentzea sp. NBRC 102530]|uniref:(2,3-dihydroxybenzoyl)adenylate synthase n=1 Tax=Lentzea sp. NBRC 102530 TaxID=3032201 RepID=UPI0024A23A67|nr:AMP-binding protein [Lentzea sp. NBRC 102530]GLY51411.1 2,3-dihydroxybenzoate-AMP ligase [Lentzea sp. NBRC 102530]
MLDGYTPWPDEVARNYRSTGIWRGETLGTALSAAAARFGPRTALVHNHKRYTYAELDEWANRLAAGFADAGIGPRDCVAVQLPNVPEFVAICFGLFRLGAVPVFALAAHRDTELRHLCGHTEAVAYVGPGVHRDFDHRALGERLHAELPHLRSTFVLDALPEGQPRTFAEPDASDVAFFLLSGGTTALPKLIPRTHDDYLYQARTAASVCELTGDDVYLAALPVEFNFAWGCPGVIGTLLTGGTVVIADDPSPETCFPLLANESVTVTSLVPSLTQLWVEEAGWTVEDLRSLRLLQVGGARMKPEFVRSIGPSLGCELQQVFGMAEGLLTFTRAGASDEHVLGTQGLPISRHDEMLVVDEGGAPLPPGGIGELITRGPYTVRGYYRADEHNAKVFTEDGFYRTGDLARLTEHGELVIEGRIKDMIIRGGDKISAGEVEAYLVEHPAVAAAAVVGFADEFLGERTCAYVVPQGTPPTLAELRESMYARGVAEYKLPDRLELIDALPLTPLGKPDKKALRAKQ